MIATEFKQGQGFGNQLFCYIVTRCLALEKGYDFGFINKELFERNFYDRNGRKFINPDLGIEVNNINNLFKLKEREVRLLQPNSIHDIKFGIQINGYDERIINLKDNTLIEGNLQDESYFIKYKSQVIRWLEIENDSNIKDFCNEDVCILNIRGGEYTNNPELFLNIDYWVNSMNIMKSLNPKFQFKIITDDIEVCQRMFPQIPAFHDFALDYIILNKAHYLILSNSSFSFFPVFTNTSLKYLLAPKYWARHNVSNGYWASEQNIYTGWNYVDRFGEVFTAEQCRNELDEYRNHITINPKFLLKIVNYFKYFFLKIDKHCCERMKPDGTNNRV